MKLSKRTMMYMIGGALLTTSVAACHHGMHYGSAEERGEWMAQKVSKELELNDLQQTRLAELKDELLDLRTSLRSDREQMRTEVLAMLQQPTLDRNKANAMVSEQVATINSRSPMIIDAIANFYDSLDDAQRAELRDFIQRKIEHQHGYRPWH
jgi:Spy/CpxP family protein refolding chaperone